MSNRAKFAGRARAVLFVSAGLATCGSLSCGKKSQGDSTLTKTTVTPTEGGTLASADGKLTLSIPAGAVSATIEISVRQIPSPVSIAGAVGTTAYEFLPDGLALAAPATLSLAVSLTSLRGFLGSVAQILDGGVSDGGAVAVDGGVLTNGVPFIVPVLTSAAGESETLGDASVTVSMVPDASVVATGALSHFSWVTVKVASLISILSPDVVTMTVGQTERGEISMTAYPFYYPSMPANAPSQNAGPFLVEEHSAVATAPTLSIQKEVDNTGYILAVDGTSSNTAKDWPKITCNQAGTGEWGADFSGRWGSTAGGVWSTNVDAGIPIRGRVTLKIRGTATCVSSDGGTDGGADAGDAGQDAGEVDAGFPMRSCYKWLPGSVRLTPGPTEDAGAPVADIRIDVNDDGAGGVTWTYLSPTYSTFYGKISLDSLWVFAEDAGAVTADAGASRVSFANGQEATDPNIFVDRTGLTWVIFSQSFSPASVWAARASADAGVPSQAVRVSANTGNFAATDPVLVGDRSRNLFTAWTETDNVQFNVGTNRFSASTDRWDDAGILTNLFHPLVAVDGNGNVLMTVEEWGNNINAVRVRLFAAGGGAPVDLGVVASNDAGGAGFPMAPQPAVSETGFLVYYEKIVNLAAAVRALAVRRLPTPLTALSAEEVLVTLDAGLRLRDVAVANSFNHLVRADGSLVPSYRFPAVVAASACGGGTCNLISATHIGGTWAFPAGLNGLTSTDPPNVRLAMTPGGNAVAVWGDSSGGLKSVKSLEYTYGQSWSDIGVARTNAELPTVVYGGGKVWMSYTSPANSSSQRVFVARCE